MRRIAAMALTLLLAAAALTGCGPLVEDAETTIDIYASFYPIYALTDALMEGVPNAALHCLVQPQDGCLRSYQLSDWDLYLLNASADAVILGGRGLESFEGALFSRSEGGPAVSAVLYNLELYSQGRRHASEENESHLDGPNPHLYMSVRGAESMMESIAAMLETLDPRYASKYEENRAAAFETLDQLKAEVDEAAEAMAGQRVLLMNEALIYVARDYGLEVAEWIDRESGVALYDQELTDCIERLNRAKAKVVLIERQAPRSLTDALEAAGYEVAGIDIFSTHGGGEGFDTYMEVQRGNMQAVVDAFERASAKEERAF